MPCYTRERWFPACIAQHEGYNIILITKKININLNYLIMLISIKINLLESIILRMYNAHRELDIFLELHPQDLDDLSVEIQALKDAFIRKYGLIMSDEQKEYVYAI